MHFSLIVLFRRSSCVLILPLIACGGSSSGGGSPSGPSGPSVPTHSVAVTVFYDENSNGRLDPDEGVRLPGIEVGIGTGSGTTGVGTGQAAVTGILEGSYSVALREGSIPSFYQAGAEIPIQVPASTAVFYPVVLPIGDNNTNLYLGFGDSITAGDGSSNGAGYGLRLQNELGPHLGRAEVRLSGRSADTSIESTQVIKKDMRNFAPAYTLVLLGTNDWHDQSCQDAPAGDCFTIDALRSILQEVRGSRSRPVLGTLLPVNPALAPEGRNLWVDEMNDLIRGLASEQGAVLADVNAAFRAQGDLSSLFADDVHPNDAGYEVLAEAWFGAITGSRSAAASSGFGSFGFAFGD